MYKRKRLIVIFGLVFVAGISLLFFFQQQYVTPIIMYHSILPQANPENRLAVSLESFERQMRFLREHKYNVLPLKELVFLIKEKKVIPPRTIAITFDDGYKDNFTHAFSILKKYRIPATVFIIVKEVGRMQQDRLSWGQIREMQACGLVTIGSHAMGPDPLTNIYKSNPSKYNLEAYFKEQVYDSRKILEEQLQRPVDLFSYPEGRFNEDIRRRVISAGYKAAVATNPGKKYPSRDVFALKRLRISSACDNLLVFWIETSGYYNFIREHRHK